MHRSNDRCAFFFLPGCSTVLDIITQLVVLAVALTVMLGILQVAIRSQYVFMVVIRRGELHAKKHGKLKRSG